MSVVGALRLVLHTFIPVTEKRAHLAVESRERPEATSLPRAICEASRRRLLATPTSLVLAGRTDRLHAVDWDCGRQRHCASTYARVRLTSAADVTSKIPGSDFDCGLDSYYDCGKNFDGDVGGGRCCVGFSSPCFDFDRDDVNGSCCARYFDPGLDSTPDGAVGDAHPGLHPAIGTTKTQQST